MCDPSHAQQRSIEALLEESIRGGVSVVQLREKNCSNEQFIALVRRAKPVLKAHRIPMIINDRIDIAIAEKAQGLHIGQSDLPWQEARRLLGPRALLGLSVETPDQADAAQSASVDYLGVSSLFPTETKTDTRSHWGLDALSTLSRRTRLPLVAIGGIDSSNAQSVIESGADSIAVVSAICADRDPRSAAHQLKEAIHQGLKNHQERFS